MTMLPLSSSVHNDNQSFPNTMTMAKTTTRIAVSGYKNSRKSHVGIHLWEAPSSSSSSSSTMTNNSKKRKQIMIVHIDDHSIFASSATTTTTITASKQSTSTAQPQHPESVPATLKVGMKLISVNGTTIRQHHSIPDVYTMLQNAIGCVTLLVGTPTIATSIIDNDHTATDEKISADAWMEQDYDRIPVMEPLIANDEYTSSSSSSSSAASSFSSYSSTSSSHQPKCNTSCINEDSDDEDEDESIINNAYALENRIRSIWSPVLTNGNGSISNRQRHR
jgi:hypothetical protein